MINDTTLTSGSLEIPGAHLHYEVRGHGPLLVLVGSPMDATAFAPAADLLAPDHTVVTIDPPGINRSTVDDGDRDSTPELARRRSLAAPRLTSMPVRLRCSDRAVVR